MGVIKRQGIKNLISTYLGFIIGFVNLIIIQPYFLTKEELGLTRLLYSFALLLAMFVPMGIGNATTKYFPFFKDPEKKHHGYLPFLVCFVAAGYVLVGTALYFLRDFIMDQYRTESPLFNQFFTYVFPLVFALSFISVLNIYCNVNYKSTVPGYLNDIFTRLASIVVITLYFNQWLTLNGFIAAFTSIYIIQLLVLIGYILTFDRITFKIDWQVFREKKVFSLVSYGMLLWFASVASLGLKYFDTVMLGKFMPLGFVAIYTIASFIPTLIEAPSNALEKIAAPKIAHAWRHNNMEEIRNIYEKSSLYMTVLGGLLFLLVNSNIQQMLSFLPDDYQGGMYVVLIISIGTLINMITGMNIPILFNSDRYRYGAVLLILLAVIVLLLQYMLIPILGMEGAALATCIASLIYNAVVFYLVYRFYHLQPVKRRTLQVLLLITMLFIPAWFWQPQGDPFLLIGIRSLIIIAVYSAIIYYLNIVPEFHHFIDRFRKK
jgi:O-antigen/teichoic acid export membrane protein